MGEAGCTLLTPSITYAFMKLHVPSKSVSMDPGSLSPPPPSSCPSLHPCLSRSHFKIDTCYKSCTIHVRHGWSQDTMQGGGRGTCKPSFSGKRGLFTPHSPASHLQNSINNFHLSNLCRQNKNIKEIFTPIPMSSRPLVLTPLPPYTVLYHFLEIRSWTHV